ncbi:unnamed protein product [Somion occarium]|uniref:Peptidase A1 domain-containing protein n=1 Tax=Somion occarium TaxID=3059160 RepID=A0ABP1DHF1_9APHY
MIHLALFAFVLGVCSHPLEDHGSSSPGGSAKWEAQRVLNKYALASQFLQGIGLNPNAHPETGYPIFNDTAAWLNYTSSHGPTRNVTRLLSTDAVDDSTLTPGIPGLTTMPMTDYNAAGYDMLYYGPLQFGTPGQALTVDVDTGSADLWVPSNCGTCTLPQYKTKSSSTYKSTGHKFTANYGIGQAGGKIVHDVVSMKTLRVQNQAFGAVNYESDNFYEYPNSGLMGLAFGVISTIGQPTFFENILKSQQLEFALFGIHLTRNQVDGSEVCFGCIDFTKTADRVAWFPLKSKTYWTIAMDGIASDADHFHSAELIAAIDTGTSMVYLPDDVTTNFYAMIPDSRSAEMEYGAGYYVFPCSAKLSISLSFSGQKFEIRTDDFNMGPILNNGEECLGGIVSLGDGFPSNLAIIGDIFLKSWYSVYDYTGARVGLAPSVNNT